MTRSKKFLMTTLALGALTVAVAMQFGVGAANTPSGYQLPARHGADDPAGDDRGGRRGGHGADDPGGGRRGGHGADDGVGYA